MRHQAVKLRLEGRVGLGRTIFAVELEDERHQRLGDIAAAEIAEMARRIGLLAERIGKGHRRSAAWRKAVILSTSLRPGALSTPDDTSSKGAPVDRAASEIFTTSSPPDNAHGSGCTKPSSNFQSKRRPIPPGSVPLGVG